MSGESLFIATRTRLYDHLFRFLISSEKPNPSSDPLASLSDSHPVNQIAPPSSHGARHGALRRQRRKRRPHPRGGGDDSPGHPPCAAAAGPLRVLRGGPLLRPRAGEPGAQGVERAGAAAAEQPPHRHRLPPAPPAAPPPRRRAPRPAPPRALPPRARLPPRPAPARALLARLPPILPRRGGPLPRAHALRRAARPPRAALRAAAQGCGRRGTRRIPPRPLGPAMRRRRRRAPWAHGRCLLRAPRAQAAACLRVRDGHRAGRGRAGVQGGRVLPARRQRRRWSRLRGGVVTCTMPRTFLMNNHI